LLFTVEGEVTTYYAVNIGKSALKLLNPFVYTSSANNVRCSFEGGCEYSVQGTRGIQSLLKTRPDKNYIKVCERTCVFDDTNSVAGEAKCTLPAIPTTYSNSKFNIGKL
jgi:hypothetical protein